MRVLSKTATTITLDQETSVTIGDVVTLTYFMVYNKKIRATGIQLLGSGIIGSFKIPSTYTAGITYKNTTKELKRIAIDIETTF